MVDQADLLGQAERYEVGDAHYCEHDGQEGESWGLSFEVSRVGLGMVLASGQFICSQALEGAQRLEIVANSPCP